MAKSDVLFGELLNDSELNAVVEVANKVGIHPNWLMGVMNFESGLNPRATNPASQSVGLIQFTRDAAGISYKTINGRRYDLLKIKAMTFEQQMWLVGEYLKPFNGKIHNFLDLYMVVFFPAAIGKPDDYVFETSKLSASLIARQNPAFDLNGDQRITKGEVLDFFRKRYVSVFDKLNVSSGNVRWYSVLLGVVGVFFYTVLTAGCVRGDLSTFLTI